MAYADIEVRRLYARNHYQANKAKYNPSKKAGTAAAPKFAEKVLAQSEQRFVYPDEIEKICRDEYGEHICWAVYKYAFLLGWLPEEAKRFGLFLRRPPFAYCKDTHIKETYLKRLSKMPKIKRGIRAELLILELVSKEKHIWTRPN